MPLPGDGPDARRPAHAADIVVVAAGPWSRDVAGLPEVARPPVRPIKGQMLALQMDPAARWCRSPVGAEDLSRAAQRRALIIGATVEERGFDSRLTAGGILSLLEAAWRAVPGIEELPIAEMWAGFRPARATTPLCSGRVLSKG